MKLLTVWCVISVFLKLFPDFQLILITVLLKYFRTEKLRFLSLWNLIDVSLPLFNDEIIL